MVNLLMTFLLVDFEEEHHGNFFNIAINTSSHYLDNIYTVLLNASFLILECYVREHYGGFTRWEADITPFVRIWKNEIELEW